ncbi:HD-GYP domain-containing protein [Ideonella livida]|uniref:Phosphohydrolase n=1 Tax=Ideonella livida TaxID=2707176 RepID=A0A7C9TKL0_9BURK|nr:hypothetical protein [Ideonella livida]NDY91942.1 hypothetical protein [Ideonella livida]
MKLIPVPADDVEAGRPLPFTLRDQHGAVLVARGARLQEARHLEHLQAHALFVEAGELERAQRLLQREVTQKLHRDDTTLAHLAALKPTYSADSGARRPGDPEPTWPDLQARARILLADTSLPDWQPRLDELLAELLQQFRRRPDELLARTFYEAGTSFEDYATHHALLVMLLCDLAGPRLPRWDPSWETPLLKAALTMNIGMHALQNQLAREVRPLSAPQQVQVRAHAQLGMQLLQAAGVTDPLWLEAVRLHHDQPQGPVEERTPAARLGALIQRADRYAVRMSIRRGRPALSARVAAQQAFFSEGGSADEAGLALLGALGLYPPGTWVRLASGETALVLKRQAGPKAPQQVAALLNREGLPLAVPALRITVPPRHEVAEALPSSEVRMRPHLDQLFRMA